MTGHRQTAQGVDGLDNDGQILPVTSCATLACKRQKPTHI